MYIVCARDPENKPFVFLAKTLAIDWPSLSQGDGPFARALRKHGIDAFHVFLLEEVEDVYGLAWIEQCKNVHITKLKADTAGYNVSVFDHRESKLARQRDGEGASMETRQRQSEGQKKAVAERGEWREYHPFKSEETRAIHAKKQSVLKNRAGDYIATDPQGNTHKVTNLKMFCEQHKLNVGHMSSVAGGKRKHHKGWTCIKDEGAKHESKSMEKG